jgi:hypothetical protein
MTLALLLATAPNAAAYNFLCPGGVCLHWQKVNSAPSTVLKVFLDASLTQQEVNLKPVVRDTIDAFNALPALNPWLNEVTSDCCEHIKVRTYTYAEEEIFGEMVPQYYTSSGLMIHALIRFNTKINWTTATGGSCYTIGGVYECAADARKVSNHEMGHAQGLAHTFAPEVSIMRQGWLSYYQLRDDDKNGIVAIYGAYNP